MAVVQKKRNGRTYYLAVVNYTDGTGKTRQISKVAATRKEGKLAEAELLKQREAGKVAAPQSMTVGDWLAQWLDEIRPNVGDRTYATYAIYTKKHLTPVVGAIRLRELKPQHVKTVHKAMYDKGLAGTTALHAHRILREALQEAFRMGHIYGNPADVVSAPKSSTSERRPATVEELHRLLKVADETDFGPMVRLTLATGMRLGEVLGLRWIDVTLKQDGSGQVRVQQTYGGDNVFRQPKTKTSKRTIAVDASAVGHLAKQRMLRPTGELVFCQANGEPITQSMTAKAWKAICEKAEVADIRFHDLRHAHATFLLAQRIPLNVVQKRLGHSLPSTTLNIYAHAMPGDDETASAIMSDALKGSV